MAASTSEDIIPSCDESYYNDDDEDEDDVDGLSTTDVRHLKRWAPLGSNASSSPQPNFSERSRNSAEQDRMEKLEEEQEQLNMSLLSLTTHFAQVQFRLKQIVDAPNNEKEVLLKNLEEFAFKGIPDLNACHELKKKKQSDDMSDKEHDNLITKQREKQMELISQLKSQLEDLETFAYETGEASIMPTSRILEKQKVVIDQLMKKLSLKDLEHLDQLSSEQLCETIDRAIGQILYPGKVKEKLVDQLKTQITDLERFIEFLQGDNNGNNNNNNTIINKNDYNNNKMNRNQCTCGHSKQNEKDYGCNSGSRADSKRLRDQTSSLMRQAATALQIFIITQFGCGGSGKEFQKNLLKRTSRGNHWGDLRARLEISISRIVELCNLRTRNRDADVDAGGDAESGEIVMKVAKRRKRSSTNSYDESFEDDCDMEIVNAVRKDLAISLRDLMQHGLVELEHSQSIVPFGCFSSRNSSSSSKLNSSGGGGSGAGSDMMHAWQLFLKYYRVKHGKKYSEAPARKLSMAFGLESVGGKVMTPKQTLLTAIEMVSSTHQPLKRNDDSQFKAFICLALNQKKLVSWLRIMLRCEWLVEYYYQPWSYVVKTGFNDALISLDNLSKIDFDLPTDLAIRPFLNIRDAF
ncbi:hypothetical protein HELRODRAFT_112004 [Helobdella robusta]|uniref:RUN domain-containing protein n=1 Tax=Helobdella robusta TaxID=6412 RepID=T1EFG3_HELRO|nr:hypothetical protein HELRODRAFT_112004 [Helobdella robusta]ESO03552.1 hypothetical protein HELRODRAFT_112004 [Helobdella robusta]